MCAVTRGPRQINKGQGAKRPRLTGGESTEALSCLGGSLGATGASALVGGAASWRITRASRPRCNPDRALCASQTQNASSHRLHFGLRGVISQVSGKFISYGSCSFF
jgi:hypothetical protein